MLDMRFFLTAVLIGVIGIIIITAIYVYYMTRQNKAAALFIRQQHEAYCQAEGYHPLTTEAAQRFCKENFYIPQHYWANTVTADRFWLEGYAWMIECLLALNADPQSRPSLHYGSLQLYRPYRIKGKPIFRMLLWVEFFYRGRRWIFWMEPSQESTDDVKIYVHHHEVFFALGEAYTKEYYTADQVAKLLQHIQTEQSNQEQG